MTANLRARSVLGNLGDYALARLIVAIRAVVVASIGAILVLDTAWFQRNASVLLPVLAITAGYSLVLLARPRFELRRGRYAGSVAAIDASLSLMIIAVTGGVESPVVSALMLTVIAAGVRMYSTDALVFAGGASVAYFGVCIGVESSRNGPLLPPLVHAAWWALYLVLSAVLVGCQAAVAEREHHARVEAMVEAAAEQAAAEEERDLRARLLQAYESQQDGLRVLLHEFRTPLASLKALTSAMVDDSAPMSSEMQSASTKLASGHVRHLSEMLDALGDVALSRNPAFATGRERRIDIVDEVVAAGETVGLPRSELRVRAYGQLASTRIDAQGFRRVVTNLLENAARHGKGAPVDVVCRREGSALTVSVLDRGVGIPPERLGQVTSKYVSLGSVRGTSGLGLWIVQQITEAMGGELHITPRKGGGLITTFRVPVG